MPVSVFHHSPDEVGLFFEQSESLRGGLLFSEAEPHLHGLTFDDGCQHTGNVIRLEE